MALDRTWNSPKPSYKGNWSAPCRHILHTADPKWTALPQVMAAHCWKPSQYPIYGHTTGEGNQIVFSELTARQLWTLWTCCQPATILLAALLLHKDGLEHLCPSGYIAWQSIESQLKQSQPESSSKEEKKNVEMGQRNSTSVKNGFLNERCNI